ncbi:unnamed protein product, partial [Didymodactylos carnosus]
MEKPAKPEETGSELQRVFVLYLPIARYAGRSITADDYPIIIYGHFGSTNLHGLFNPDSFFPSSGLTGRQRQIADLSVDKLYRLAFTYSLFTGDRSFITNSSSRRAPVTAANIDHMTDELSNISLSTDEDELRRTHVLRHLLTIEYKFQNESRTIAKEYFLPNSSTMVQLNQELLYLTNEDSNMVISDSVACKDNHSVRQLLETKNDELENNNLDVKVTTTLVSLKDVMTQWQDGTIGKSTNAIATALPMLTAMQMAFHKTLK